MKRGAIDYRTIHGHFDHHISCGSRTDCVGRLTFHLSAELLSATIGPPVRTGAKSILEKVKTYVGEISVQGRQVRVESSNQPSRHPISLSFGHYTWGATSCRRIAHSAAAVEWTPRGGFYPKFRFHFVHPCCRRRSTWFFWRIADCEH